MDSWPTIGGFSDLGFPIADGEIAYLNAYDMQIYAIGKGPSKLTVTAPDTAAAFGTPVVIRGAVTDISAGTEQDVIARRFPNGVPAVSDTSMGDWMEYVFMQKPRPTNVIGVEVTLSVLDSNNNFREIGKATADADGFYSLMWTPDISGKFTVYASFAGSESYWPSHAETAFGVMEPAEPVQPIETPPPPPTEMYVLGAAVAIIIAIAIAAAATVLMLKKRA
jgi:hypothetical protein